MSKNKRFILDVFWILILVIFDQITKKIAVSILADGNVPVIPGVLSFTLLEGGNSGAAFGLLKGGFWFFIFTTAAVIFFGFFTIRKMPVVKRFVPLRISVILLLAGAFGNLTDRISTMIEHGTSFVIDFIYFELIDFPIFNIADCYVTIAAGLLILLGIFYYNDEDYNKMLGREVHK